MQLKLTFNKIKGGVEADYVIDIDTINAEGERVEEKRNTWSI